jgi:hypothetical protein
MTYATIMYHRPQTAFFVAFFSSAGGDNGCHPASWVSTWPLAMSPGLCCGVFSVISVPLIGISWSVL